MEISELRPLFNTIGIKRSLFLFRRILLLAPFRILLSIGLVFIAGILYRIFPSFQTNIPLYIAALIVLFGASVWAFEYHLEDIDQIDDKEQNQSLQYQGFRVKPSQSSYSREELKDLLKTLNAHQVAIFNEHPDVFVRFKTESEHRLILIVQDVKPAGELLKTAFHQFGFTVLLITSLEADHKFIYENPADLVVCDADLRRNGLIFQAMKNQQIRGNARLLLTSAIILRPDILRSTFEVWLDRYPQTFADAFFWHLFQAASAIPKLKGFSASMGETVHSKSSQ